MWNVGTDKHWQGCIISACRLYMSVWIYMLCSKISRMRSKGKWLLNFIGVFLEARAGRWRNENTDVEQTHRTKRRWSKKRKWAGESGGTVVGIGLCSNTVTLLKRKVFKYLTHSSIIVHPNHKHFNSIQPHFSIYRLCFATLHLCWLFRNIWKASNERILKRKKTFPSLTLMTFSSKCCICMCSGTSAYWFSWM